jgi:hypothetical protein
MGQEKKKEEGGGGSAVTTQNTTLHAKLIISLPNNSQHFMESDSYFTRLQSLLLVPF